MPKHLAVFFLSFFLIAYCVLNRNEGVAALDRVIIPHQIILSSDITGGLLSIYDLAADAEDQVWIADYRNARILIVAKDGRYTQELRGFSNPHSIALDGRGAFYVTDLHGGSFAKYNETGKLIWRAGSKGSDNGQFLGAVSIRVNREGQVYVADYKNHRIQKFSADGKWIKSWGQKGKLAGEFNLPHGLAIDQQDRVYVADRKNNRIQVFDSDGVFLRDFNKSHWGEREIEPLGVYVDSEGNIWIADMLEHRILKLSQEGRLLVSFGRKGSEPGEFNTPTNLAIDRGSRIWVAEEGNHRIQIFDSGGL